MRYSQIWEPQATPSLCLKIHARSLKSSRPNDPFPHGKKRELTGHSVAKLEVSSCLCAPVQARLSTGSVILWVLTVVSPLSQENTLYPETHDALHLQGETREEKTCQEWSKGITPPIDFILQFHIFNHSIHGFGRNFLSFKREKEEMCLDPPSSQAIRYT